MKRMILSMLVGLLLVGCSDNREEAISDLIENQVGNYSIHVFNTERAPSTSELGMEQHDYYSEVNRVQNAINNEILVNFNESILNTSIMYLNEKQYDYDKIFDIADYPTIIVMKKREEIFRTSHPDDIYDFFEKLYSSEDN